MLDRVPDPLLPAALRDEMMRPAARFRTAGPGRPWRRPAHWLGLMVDLDRTRGLTDGHTGAWPCGNDPPDRCG